MAGQAERLKAALKERVAAADAVAARIRSEQEVLATFPRPEAHLDEEGFPRSDVDVNLLMATKHALARLQNDHKDAMREVEAAMRAYHEALRSDPGAKARMEEERAARRAEAEDEVKQQQQQREERPPRRQQGGEARQEAVVPPSRDVSAASLEGFYAVDEMFEGSPASAAGLRTGDVVLKFGSVTKENETPGALAAVVQGSEGRPLPVVVYRNGEGVVEVSLVPRQWGGRGLLGCHLARVHK